MWDKRLLSLAKEIAGWSKDQGRHVGCVLTNSSNRVIATGYNGLPRGLDNIDLPREQMKLLTLHAEVNALLDANRDFQSCYVWPTLPCVNCAIMLAQSGCARFVSAAQCSAEWHPGLQSLLAKRYNIEVILIPESELTV